MTHAANPPMNTDAHKAEGAVRELIERGIELARSYAIFMELADEGVLNFV